MSRAGWCRECGEWVWVDEQDACVHGHGAECVGGIYDAEPKPEPVPREHGMGQGEMPAELKRFNWGAFFLPFFWGTAYGVWRIVYFWVLAFMSPLLLLMLVGLGGEAAMQASMTGVIVVSQIIAAVVRLWVGMSANTLLWQRESARLEAVAGAVPRFSTDRFASRQRTWLIVGIVITALSVMGLAVIALAPGEASEQVRSQLSLTPGEAGLSALWLTAEIVLGFWLAFKMKQESSPLQPHGCARDSD